MGRLFQRTCVEETRDLHRILGLPRRTWTDEQLEVLAKQLTAVLKTPQGEWSFRPLQALALHDLYVYGGLVAPLPVGTGKTLISLLAGYMMKAKRPVLFLPAALIGKTIDEQAQLSKHWRIPTNTRFYSYEMLGTVGGATFLEDYKPDLLILDEGHRARNRKAGRTRRIMRYLRDYPDVKVVVMSGTLTKHSFKDYAHLVRWALKDKSPVPLLEGEVHEWADALDEKVPALSRRAPGALLKMCTPEDLQNDPLTAARLGFQRRFVETPGIVAAKQSDQVACSLYIRALPYTMAPQLEKMYDDLRSLMVTPDGWELMIKAEVWRHARELALGFHGIWSPRPPEEWRMARKMWAQFVRSVLKDSETYDTEKQVKNACERGELDREAYDHWVEIEPTFEVHAKPVWHDDAALKVCEKWMSEGPGLVWVAHTFFGKELSRRTGAPYYREDGKDADGNPVEKADPSKAIIVSYDSNKVGRNLQMFNRNLITACPSGADDLEQLIGRTHRSGQMADEVTVDIMLACREHAQSWLDALADARATRDSLGQPQKILTADVVGFPTEWQLLNMKGAAWNVHKTQAEWRPT